MSRKTLIFAGGGTGGHVYPLVAVAEAAAVLAPDLRLVFVGTSRGLEARVVPERGFELELIEVLPLRGAGLGGALRGVVRALRTLPEARALVRRLQPQAVFSVGGYAAGPVSLAAWLSGVPLGLLEPNSVIGLANRLVAPLVARAYTAFPESEKHFKKERVLRAGVPIRAGFEPRPYGGHGPLKLLVLGGSQGAKALNEAVPRAIAKADERITVTHQCGRGQDQVVRELYASLGLSSRANVVAFIDDMPRAIADADLIVGRSGASAVSEICAVGRPGIYVPYPFAAGDHQRHNALSLENAGAGVCVPSADATPERLAAEIDRLTSDRGRLASMAESARSLGKPDAARIIAQDLLELAGLVPSGSAPSRHPDGKSNGHQVGSASLAQRGEPATTHQSWSDQISIGKSGDEPQDKPARPARLAGRAGQTRGPNLMELGQAKTRARLAQRAEQRATLAREQT